MGGREAFLVCRGGVWGEVTTPRSQLMPETRRDFKASHGRSLCKEAIKGALWMPLHPTKQTVSSLREGHQLVTNQGASQPS